MVRSFAPRRRRSARRCDVHRYGRPAEAGGGISRAVCVDCGHVMIDLTAIDRPSSPEGLFDERPDPVR